jgi:hypothetical protein
LAQDSANYHEHSRELLNIGAGLPAPENGLQFFNQHADPARHPAGVLPAFKEMLIHQVQAGQHRSTGARALIELAVDLSHLPVDDSRDFLNVLAVAVGFNIIITAKDVNDN